MLFRRFFVRKKEDNETYFFATGILKNFHWAVAVAPQEIAAP
jgi:hypothetical protein